MPHSSLRRPRSVQDRGPRVDHRNVSTCVAHPRRSGTTAGAGGAVARVTGQAWVPSVHGTGAPAASVYCGAPGRTSGRTERPGQSNCENRAGGMQTTGSRAVRSGGDPARLGRIAPALHEPLAFTLENADLTSLRRHRRGFGAHLRVEPAKRPPTFSCSTRRRYESNGNRSCSRGGWGGLSTGSGTMPILAIRRAAADGVLATSAQRTIPCHFGRCSRSALLESGNSAHAIEFSVRIAPDCLHVEVLSHAADPANVARLVQRVSEPSNAEARLFWSARQPVWGPTSSRAVCAVLPACRG